MKINIVKKIESVAAYEIIAIPIFEGESYESGSCGGFKVTVDQVIENDYFQGKKGQLYNFPSFGHDSSRQILLIGMGNKSEWTQESLMNTLGNAARHLRSYKKSKICITLDSLGAVLKNKHLFKMAIVALFLGHEVFDKFKTDPESKSKLEELAVVSNLIGATAAVKDAQKLADAILLSRRLVNEPAGNLKPTELAEEAKAAGKRCGFSVKIFDQGKIAAMGMSAFLSVARGSDAPPKLIVMQYKGDSSSNEILGLVGKGLTYDSGGYSIKPTDFMIDMKDDMGGSAAVIGAMCAIAESGLKINVTAIVAACENMISGHAYVPGDIIPTMAGKTIEIVNTDAEGRLTLIDAVHYAIEKEKVTRIVDVATLTGAQVVALGEEFAGVLTNDEHLWKAMEKASEESGDKIWRLPATEYYADLNKSAVADLKNSGGRWGGCSIAGMFIKDFVGDTPWVHVDIAGPAFLDKDRGYRSKGGTGFGAALLYSLAKELAK